MSVHMRACAQVDGYTHMDTLTQVYRLLKTMCLTELSPVVAEYRTIEHCAADDMQLQDTPTPTKQRLSYDKLHIITIYMAWVWH